MKKLLAALSLAVALATTGALSTHSVFAQAMPPNEMGVTMGHLHLNSRDIEANKKILVAVGGTYKKNGNFDLVMFPGVAIFLNQGPGTPPPVGGTVGTVVNHFGFLVPNVQTAMAKWKAASVPVEPGGNGRLDQAFVTTPDGVRIEILEDKSQTIPIRHHHIHFYVPAAEIPKIQAWYAKTFGAKPGMRGQNVAADLPGANLSFSKSDTALVSTKGHTLDHIGFDVKNLEAFCKKAQADGIKVDRPYTKNAQSGTGICFIYDPWGTYIELNERPKPL
jgi:catechol 2,3-dioxygenase-like lactoylglutathione lyase family enzyme